MYFYAFVNIAVNAVVQQTYDHRVC